jgi:hypothetical protein
MDKWLGKFLDDTLENQTDKADILPELVSVSGMSVPFSESPGGTSPLHPTPQNDRAPTPPLQPGWLVVYRDRRGVLCGGGEDREHGTVEECRWAGNGWTVHLIDWQRLPLSSLHSVGKTDSTGQIVAAWTVQAHGYDGEGPITRGGRADGKAA